MHFSSIDFLLRRRLKQSDNGFVGVLAANRLKLPALTASWQEGWWPGLSKDRGDIDIRFPVRGVAPASRHTR
jgi:hypothetical protein